MKRILSFILALIFLLSITACKNNSNASSSIPDNTTSGFIDLDIIPEDENNTSNPEQNDNTNGDGNNKDQNSDNNLTSDENSTSENNNGSLSSDYPLNNSGKDESNTSHPDVDTITSPTKNPTNNTANDKDSIDNNGNNELNNTDKDNTNSNKTPVDTDKNPTNTSDNDNNKDNNKNPVTDNKNPIINIDKNNNDQNNNPDKDTSNTDTNTEENSPSDNTTNTNKDNLNNTDNNNDKNPNSNDTDKDNTDKDNTTNNNTDNGNNTKPPQTNTPDNENSGNKNDNEDNTPENDSTNSGNKAAYKDISCRNVTEWKTVELVSNNNSLYFSIVIPKDWNIDNNGNIKINTSQIGQLCTKLTENFTNIYEEIKSEHVISGTTASSSIREYAVNNELKYKRIVKISKLGASGNLLNLFISADYSQLDDNSASKILNSISDKNSYKPSPLLDKNSNKNVLFLGNNNIENSKIDEFLNSMLNKSNVTIQAEFKQPVGGGEVKNYAANTSLMNEISNGNFSIVFLNGFYKEENTIEPIKTIVDACEKSNTMLVLLPAYDDSSSIVENILAAHPEIFSINWKNEIQNVISNSNSNSISASDFYSNSSESSSELSGYVGAHLIYRTIFAETPPSISENLPVGYEKIKNYLSNIKLKKDIFFIK